MVSVEQNFNVLVWIPCYCGLLFAPVLWCLLEKLISMRFIKMWMRHFMTPPPSRTKRSGFCMTCPLQMRRSIMICVVKSQYLLWQSSKLTENSRTYYNKQTQEKYYNVGKLKELDKSSFAMNKSLASFTSLRNSDLFVQIGWDTKLWSPRM